MAAWGEPGRTPLEASRLRLALVGVALVSLALLGIAILLWRR